MERFGTISPTLTTPNPTTSPFLVNINANGTTSQDPAPVTRKAFYNAFIATNSISLAACVLAISVYFVLRRKHPRLMSRTSLKLSIAMACSDVIYHCANLTRYFDIPNDFACGLVGGWLFATPCFLSTFLSCAIALNTQLVVVHQRVPKDSTQILYFVIPPILALLISTPALIAGVYGYDEVVQGCWYATRNLSIHTVLVRKTLTWDLWLFIALVYLIVAVIMIIHRLLSKRGPFSGLAMSKYLSRHPSRIRSPTTDANATLATTLERGEMARRALTVRVLGYISAPIITVFPTVIFDLLRRARPDFDCPPAIHLISAITAGLMGTFNTIFLVFDPSVVAVVFWPYWKKKKERERMQQRIKLQTGLNTRASASTRNPVVLENENLEMGDLETAEYIPQDMGSWTHGLEVYGHFAVNETAGYEPSPMSTIGYNMDELAQTFHGL